MIGKEEGFIAGQVLDVRASVPTISVRPNDQ